jgi:hypothetical protein
VQYLPCVNWLRYDRHSFEKHYTRTIKRFCLTYFKERKLIMAKGNNSQGKDKKKAKTKAKPKAKTAKKK